MSVMGMLRQLGRGTLRIAPFQQKRDACSDENEQPDPTRINLDHAHPREQEHDPSDQKDGARDNAVKNAIPKPIGEATDGHGEKTNSL